jgi:hypothetical protein
VEQYPVLTAEAERVVTTAESNSDWSEHIAADLHEIRRELAKVTSILAELAPAARRAAAYLDNPATRFRAFGRKKDE